MTREELIEKLQSLEEDTDFELTHQEADELLIQYINDPEVTEAYDALLKWYA